VGGSLLAMLVGVVGVTAEAVAADELVTYWR
jgi:hypothetical protein